MTRRLPVPNFGAAMRTLAFVLSTFLMGCGGAEPDAPRAVDEPEYDGLSREQIELQAEPMTPAEAELLGIVDSTIRIEPPMSPDSVAVGVPPSP